MVRASSVLEVTRSCDSRITRSRESFPGADEREKPCGGNAGPFQQRDFDGVSNSAGNFARELRRSLQVRDDVRALMRVDARIASGERIEDRSGDGLKSFYAACRSVFEDCSFERDRIAFEAITGESLGRFEGALDAFGRRLLPPATLRVAIADRDLLDE